MATEAQTRSGSAGRGFSITGFVLALVALFFLPILFGPAAAIFGGVGYSKGDKLGMWALVAGIVATLAGMALGYWVFTETQT